MAHRNTKLFFKTNNDFQKNVQTKQIGGEQSIVPKIQVEDATPIAQKNMTRILLIRLLEVKKKV